MKTELSRRHLLRLASLVGAGTVLPASGTGAAQRRAATAATTAAPAADASVYKAIGVRAIINCRGTLIIGGSIELPEVRAAKTAANLEYAQLDEVMNAVGKRLGELTGAEWGMVSAGCAAAMSHTTAACVAGGNPNKSHVSPPTSRAFPRTRGRHSDALTQRLRRRHSRGRREDRRG